MEHTQCSTPAALLGWLVHHGQDSVGHRTVHLPSTVTSLWCCVGTLTVLVTGHPCSRYMSPVALGTHVQSHIVWQDISAHSHTDYVMPLSSISANVTDAQREAVAEDADSRNRSKSYVIREIIVQHYDLDTDGDIHNQ
jgi:hypothetical protein